mmetsp:Transcript_27055/g.87402  ORF Transcript_27055/g.87402 Transcript_27055/m.87402 type:complete len:127 (-) Transcript_27055:334-714(-)
MLAFEPPSIWKRMGMGGGGAEGEGCAKKGKRAAGPRAAAEAGMEGQQRPTAAAEWEMGDAEAKAVEQSGPSVALDVGLRDASFGGRDQGRVELIDVGRADREEVMRARAVDERLEVMSYRPQALAE